MRSEKVSGYRRKARRRILYIAVFAVICLIISVYSLSVSKFGITMSDVFTSIVNHLTGNVPERGTGQQYYLWMLDRMIMEDTLPRTVAGVTVGAALAMCGAMMQSITRNPLTDPYTIGISSAALFGVAMSICYGICIVPFFGGDDASIVNAFVFALVPSAVIIFVSTFKKMSSTMMVLIGIGMMYMFSAFTTFMKFNAETEALHEIYEWSLGTLSKTSSSTTIPLIIAFVLILVFAMAVANRINVMSTGDNMSKSLGVNPVRLRIVCFLMMSVATAICVCYTGSIGFVGLVAPHIARLFVGSDNKVLIPTSAVIGALLVIISDIVVRSIPGGLPVGTITALIGSPMFIYFLYRQRKNAAF
ncbi:MAG: iron ABC transporter permease [Candidatus Methanomethylophilaceae archaeon]|nr:iron ABC transporter permease [Candidatus Methanomethylophilaceae archaeon]